MVVAVKKKRKQHLRFMRSRVVKPLPTLDSFIKAKFRRVIMPRLCGSSPITIDEQLSSRQNVLFFFLTQANIIAVFFNRSTQAIETIRERIILL